VSAAPAAATAPPATAAPADEPILAIPSLGRRITIGGLRAFFVLLAYGILPVTALGILSADGLSSTVPRAALVFVAVVLGLLSAAAYIARPTKWFGPISAVASLVSLAYLLYLAPIASFGFSIGGGSLSIDFGQLLRILAIVPVFGLLAAVVITVEDFARPRERVRYVYAVVR
jgi:hypothetical protein